jgi:hypothetical protein
MIPVGNILALAHKYLVKYQILFSTFRVAVSAVTDLNKKDFPLYTFCPDWLAPIHPEGLYEGKVNIFSSNTVYYPLEPVHFNVCLKKRNFLPFTGSWNKGDSD